MLEFLLICVSIGVAVSIDVSIVTIAKFRDETLSFLSWTLPIASFHIIFTALGLYGTLDWIQAQPTLRSYIHVVAGMLVLYLCFEWLSSWIGKPITYGPIGVCERLLHGSGLKRYAPNLVLMVAISLDALLGTPSISSVAVNWSKEQLGVSAVLIGVVVMALTFGSLFIAQRLRAYKSLQVSSLVRVTLVSKFFQITVIGSFGLSSLIEGFGKSLHIGIVALIAGVFVATVFTFYRKALYQQEVREAEEAIAG